MYNKQLENNLHPEKTVIAEETLDWYRMSPVERFTESQKLWEVFILLGGNYEPEPDTQSPFHTFKP
ncbi:MAG: hypothetical protein QME51_09355 [Planctomycetota bacterium]|nr:hypothetical protein [Planctomycetota bacterium]